MKRRLTTIVAADLVGYSRLMSIDEEDTIRRLRVAREEIVDPAIDDGGGRIFNVTGDGVLVEFESPVAAVRASLAIQRAMSAWEPGLADDQRLRFRVGVNVGDVAVEGDDLLGDAVNIAARLESIAPAGGICVSRPAYDQIRGRDDIKMVPLGPHAVKNIPEPIEVWQVEVEGVRAAPAIAATSDRASLAVLPFETSSGDPDLQDLAQGLAEEAINELGRFRWLKVFAYASSRALQGPDATPEAVGQRLGARYALQGSLRRSGDRLRVAASLADTATGLQIWADRFDRALDDLFELQDALASAIVTAVAPELGAHERAIATRRPTDSLDAWGFHQRALAEMAQGYHGAERLEVIEGLANRAIATDPTFAAPYAILARLAHSRAIGGWTDDVGATIQKGIVCGEKAIELDPREDAAYAALAFVLGFAQDHPLAIQIADRGVSLNPNNPAVFLARSVARFYTPPEMVNDLATHGNAIASDARAALNLSPLDPGRWAFMYMEGVGVGMRGEPGDVEAALAALRRAAREPNRAWQVHGDCALILVAMGRIDEASQALREAAQKNPKLSKSDFERVHRSTHPAAVFRQGIARLEEVEAGLLQA